MLWRKHAAMAVNILELDSVAKSYGQQVAVADVSFTIAKGEFIALMGPSGCGKTTTLRMIAGLDRPSEGEIRMWGRRLNDDPPWARDTPLVWQNYALFPFLSVRKNIEFGLKQRRMPSGPRKARAEEWMNRLNISELADRSPAQLSGGQRQRVALARALATEPEILLLDEPLSALDPHLRVKMQSELVRLNRELGITFVCVTHSHSEAFAMADRVVIMSEGRIQQVGAPRDIYRRAKNRFVAEFIGGNNILAGQVQSTKEGIVAIDTEAGLILAELPGAAETSLTPDRAATLVVPADRISIGRKSGGQVNEIAVQVATLEFIGSTVTVFLETETGMGLQAQLHLRDLEAMPLAVGDKVVAHWSPRDGYFLEL
jgi:spermidine/putrescine transport system ATP-binding protein